MTRNTRVTIDLSALQHNLQQVRAAAPHARVMAAVKANGYGHGLTRVARTLADADALAVASSDEGLLLRAAGITTPTTLLEGPFEADELQTVVTHGFTLVIHSLHQLEWLEQSTLTGPFPLWVKVDSGMHRLGFQPDQLPDVMTRLEHLAGRVKLLGTMTHLANADDRSDPTTSEQLRLFQQVTRTLPGLHSIANSAAILGWPETHADWVRPGIMLYGISPFIEGVGQEWGLRPVMRFSAELIAIKTIPKGARVGYGGSWSAPEAMSIGVVAVGYGDGYPRHAKPGTPLSIGGVELPLIGRVSMDMITVDLRGVSGAAIGDEVELWGPSVAVERVARAAGTIPYALTCGITPRVKVEEVSIA